MRGLLQKSFRTLAGISRTAIFAIQPLLVTACAVHAVWYVPDAPVGHVTSFQCGTAGLDNKWIIKREGVVFGVAVLPPANDHRKALINVGMSVPKNRIVRSSFGNLRAYGPSGEQLQGGFVGNASPSVSSGSTHIYRFNDAVTELRGSMFSTKEIPQTTYYFGLTLENSLPARLDVILPDMEINGHEYPPLTIHFTKKTGAYYVVTPNC